jgi:hypothetical protein
MKFSCETALFGIGHWQESKSCNRQLKNYICLYASNLNFNMFHATSASFININRKGTLFT